MVLTFKRISFAASGAWHFKLQRYVWRLSLDLQKPSIMITFGSIKQKPCYVIWRKLFSHPFLFNSYIQPFLRTLLARLNTVPVEGPKIWWAQSTLSPYFTSSTPFRIQLWPVAHFFSLTFGWVLLFKKRTGQAVLFSFQKENPHKSKWKKWATGESCIRKRSTTFKIGTLDRFLL